jgi:hypothetical protein
MFLFLKSFCLWFHKLWHLIVTETFKYTAHKIGELLYTAVTDQEPKKYIEFKPVSTQVFALPTHTLLHYSYFL